MGMKLTKSDDAVSPVIGVMLMLVITIVIAGVIAAFGTGMVGNTETAPTAVFDVHIYSDIQVLDDSSMDYKLTTGPDFQIKHVSGDSIDTGDLEIRLTWEDPQGKMRNSIYSADKFAAANPNGMVVTVEGGPITRTQPMYLKAPGGEALNAAGGAGETFFFTHYFGTVTLEPGQKVTASADLLDLGEENKDSPFMDMIFNNCKPLSESGNDYGIMKYLPKGTEVQVSIIHTPSSKTIFDKEISVE